MVPHLLLKSHHCEGSTGDGDLSGFPPRLSISLMGSSPWHGGVHFRETEEFVESDTFRFLTRPGAASGEN